MKTEWIKKSNSHQILTWLHIQVSILPELAFDILSTEHIKCENLLPRSCGNFSQVLFNTAC
jgi:hypothetical protein